MWFCTRMCSLFSQFAGATITKYHWLDSLPRDIFLMILEARSPRPWWQVWFLFDLQGSSPCPPLGFSLCSDLLLKAHLPCWIRAHSRDPYFNFITSVKTCSPRTVTFLSTGDQGFNLQVLGGGRTQFSSFTRMSQSLPWHCWAVWRLSPEKCRGQTVPGQAGSCEVAQGLLWPLWGLGLVLKHRLWLPHDLSVHTQTCESWVMCLKLKTGILSINRDWK